MSLSLSRRSRKVMVLASEAARSRNHSYIGTEHILLGIIEDGSTEVSEVLASLKINSATIRAEIEKLVCRGAESVALKTLPLTPRAKRAIEHAHAETQLMGETCVCPEHLFLGLVSEPEGVACEALTNSGITPRDLTKEVFKARIAQMKVVERAVRPVRASAARKRKMREELLAHLSAIYDQEQSRLHDPSRALESAARRFGEPAALSRELEAALPYHERISYFIERVFSWRAPESVVHYALRQAIVAFCILATVLPLVFAGVIIGYGWFDNVWTFIRVLAAILTLTPPTQFAFTVAWIKMRDSLWGTFGSRRSLGRALLYNAVTGLIVAAFFIGLSWAARWESSVAAESLGLPCIAGVLGAMTVHFVVRLTGPATIRDTLWAMLDINAA